MQPSDCVSVLSCTLESRCDCVRILHAMVEVVAGRVGLGCVESNRLALAASELFANIGTHGYKGKVGRVEVCLELYPEEVRVVFRDFAPTVSSLSDLQGRTLEDVRPGGLGLHLMHAAMDAVQHETLDDGNRWTLVRHLRREVKRGA